MIISVRQWQEMYQAGIFHQDALHIPEEAGWDDVYQPLDSKGLKTLCKLTMSITHPFVLDHFHVYFTEHSLGVGPRYCCACFALLADVWSKKAFHVLLDCPTERKKWALRTRRYGAGAPEFDCGNIRSMSRYINSMAQELEQDIQPVFIAEKQAVTLYAAFQGEPVNGVSVYRDGSHQFSYTSFRDRRKRTVMAVSDLNEAPSGFVLEQAEQIKGIYVYCPDGNGEA